MRAQLTARLRDFHGGGRDLFVFCGQIFIKRLAFRINIGRRTACTGLAPHAVRKRRQSAQRRRCCNNIAMRGVRGNELCMIVSGHLVQGQWRLAS